jgi:hypothetical protein
MVYGQPMGFVARCRSCDNVLMVIVERPGQNRSACGASAGCGSPPVKGKCGASVG